MQAAEMQDAKTKANTASVHRLNLIVIHWVVADQGTNTQALDIKNTGNFNLRNGQTDHRGMLCVQSLVIFKLAFSYQAAGVRFYIPRSMYQKQRN